MTICRYQLDKLIFIFQAEIGRLVSALRINLGPKPRRMKNLWGYRGGLEQLRLSVTGLIIHERIELKENRGIMTRQYTERLISDAVMYGDTHKHTMEMASWWLDSDRAAIHKLFKVLVPRFRDLEGPTSFTRLFFSPTRILTNFENFKDKYGDFVTVELRGNPFPPLEYPNSKPNKKLIHNVLLAEAARDLKMSQPRKS